MERGYSNLETVPPVSQNSVYVLFCSVQKCYTGSIRRATENRIIEDRSKIRTWDLEVLFVTHSQEAGHTCVDLSFFYNLNY